MNDRAGDIWEPLLALADLAGGHWPDKARQAAIGLTGLAQETSPIGGLLLSIIAVFIENKTRQMFSRTLVDALNRHPERFWRRLTRGKDLTDRSLAHLLRPYGIAPEIVKVEEHRSRGYKREAFNEPFRRYFSPEQARAMLDEMAAPPEPPTAPEAEPNEKSPKLLRLERQLEQLEKMRERIKSVRGPLFGGKRSDEVVE